VPKCPDGGVERRLIELGNHPLHSPTLAELRPYVRSEIVRWGKVVQQAGSAASQ